MARAPSPAWTGEDARPVVLVAISSIRSILNGAALMVSGRCSFPHNSRGELLNVVAPALPANLRSSPTGCREASCLPTHLSFPGAVLSTVSRRQEQTFIVPRSPRSRIQFRPGSRQSLSSGLAEPGPRNRPAHADRCRETEQLAGAHWTVSSLPGHDAAYEIARGKKLKAGRYAFPVTLFHSHSDSTKPDRPQRSQIVVVRAGKDEWAIDQLP